MLVDPPTGEADARDRGDDRIAGRPQTLDRVPLGRTVVVEALHLEGFLRRRLLDLGFVRGALVQPLRRSPLNDPTAYEVKGAVLAIRDREAARIEIRRAGAGPDGGSPGEGGPS